MSPILLLLSGIPGKMAKEIALLLEEDQYRHRFALAPFGLGYHLRKGSTLQLSSVVALPCEVATDLPRLLRESGGLMESIVIDYSTPGAALDNIQAYVEAGVSFVMGTTGFDRAEAVRLVTGSPVSAVIAPNMAAPIVVLQAALAHVAERFPGALQGYRLAIHESHQSTKKDVSGTARALLGPLRALGCESVTPEIEAIRDPQQQRGLGVPEEHLSGHGWHWYEAKSGAGDVTLEVSHRVNGRRVYAEGALLAAAFLHRQRAAGARGQVYSMQDVLEAGG